MSVLRYQEGESPSIRDLVVFLRKIGSEIPSDVQTVKDFWRYVSSLYIDFKEYDGSICLDYSTLTFRDHCENSCWTIDKKFPDIGYVSVDGDPFFPDSLFLIVSKYQH